jgi:hypothetical protein
MFATDTKSPNIGGFSRQLYHNAIQFAKNKSETDSDFREAWNSGYTRKVQRSKISKTPGSASVVAMDSLGRYLFVLEHKSEKKQNLFGIPGGKSEFGEHPLDTAAREFQEETGHFVHGGVLDIHYVAKKSGSPDLIIFIHVYNWKNNLIPISPKSAKIPGSCTVYMTLLSLQTALDATRMGEELYLTLDEQNRLIYRDAKKVNVFEVKREKKLEIVQEPLYIANEPMDAIRANGIRIRQAHRNDLNNSSVLGIFEKILKHPIEDITDSE